jgi:peptidyl-prolyl cis-trans isomerase C
MENKVLATVGGMPITEEDVNEFLMSLGQRAQSYNNPEGRALILNQLIDAKLLLLDAKRNLIEGEAEFRARLAKLKDNLLTNYAAEKAIANAKKVTDADVEKFYNENPDKFNMGESVNASHILVDSEEKALELYAKIALGEISFEDCAKANSSCPSKDNGGSLGDFGRGQMVPEFDAAVFTMEVGEVTSVPVKTQFGYHLIKLNSKSEAKTAPLTEVKDGIRGMLESENQRAAYESKINQLKIVYPVDKF